MNVGDYGFYYPVSWVTGEPKTDNEYYGQKCQIVEKHGHLVWIKFEDKALFYARCSEVKERRKL